MEVDKPLITELKEFQNNLSKYHDLANQIWSIKDGREYITPTEIKKQREAEQKMRSKLNVDYGSLSSVIETLNGRRSIMTMSGLRWETFPEALSGRFNLVKGESLIEAEQVIAHVIGVAQRQYEEGRKSPRAKEGGHLFDSSLLARISSPKVRQLCKEMNRCWPQNPNAVALLMRTILLITLQHKLGKKAKEDLGPVLGQVLAGNIYKDRQVTNILKNFSTMPKALLDATHHSQWMLLKDEDIRHLLSGLIKIIEATYPEGTKE